MRPLFLFAVAAVLAVPPVPGRWDDLLKQQNPWRGFEADDAVLTVTRVFRADSGKCQPWLKALVDTLPGTPFADTGKDSWAPAWSAWEPWSKSDLKGVGGCDGFPCDVKLGRAETAAMAQAPESTRLARFEALVQARVLRYRDSGQPEAYESPGGVIDPWSILEKKGYTGSLVRPTLPSWRSRHFNLDPDRMKTMHQILDVRTAQGPSEAEVWLRADYSDHYFDAWGEWRDARCGPTGDGVTIALALTVDFDLLKNTDILSRLAHGRMRNAVRDNGSTYLDGIFDELKAKEQLVPPQ